VVGGGPAGLSAALMLGRCLRRVLVFDAGQQRNASSRGIHGYLTRDGTPTGEFLELARRELERYGTVTLHRGTVEHATRTANGFVVMTADGNRHGTRKLLLATGVVDELPDLEGLEALYGTSVHHCPYCDAWEWRDQPIAVYGAEDAASALALTLRWWSGDVMLCTGGGRGIADEHLQRLMQAGVRVREDPVARLEGTGGRLERIVFAGGESVTRNALFFATGQRQRCDLAALLGCRFTEKGAVDTGSCEATNVPGLYVAGDASKEAQFVVVAAAEGAEAGMAIHKALLREELERGGEPDHRKRASAVQ
jgi:thioredoxin reductase